MKTIKLTEEQKQQLLKPNLYIAAVFFDGLEWNLPCYNEESIGYDELDGPYRSGNYQQTNSNELDELDNSAGFKIISDTVMAVSYTHLTLPTID
jgi:hypothetical protein